MKRLLLVSVESPWPPNHGGRIRTARIAEALGSHFDLLVAFPDDGSVMPQAKVATVALPGRRVSQLRTRVSNRPHVGGHQILGIRDGLQALQEKFRPDMVYWSHSYLAAWAKALFHRLPQVVEFPNVERYRQQTLAGSATGVRRVIRQVEAVKAARWEPAVARAASLCVALSQPDEEVLRRWGADVRLIQNGVNLHPYRPSPESGYVLAIASYDYEPNIRAVRRLVADIWPKVIRRLPSARLVVAGRHSESLADELLEGSVGVTVAGTLADVSEAYAGAAVTVATAVSGGGSQLKLTEAFSRGRAVVMSGFSAAGLPVALQHGNAHWVADTDEALAAALSHALRDVPDRRERELAGWKACQGFGWDATLRPLAEEMSNLSSRHRDTGASA